MGKLLGVPGMVLAVFVHLKAPTRPSASTPT